MDPDHARKYAGPDMDPNCLKGLHAPAYDTSRY